MSIDLHRRQFLSRAGMGFGALAANALLAQQAKGATAKSVISLFDFKERNIYKQWILSRCWKPMQCKGMLNCIFWHFTHLLTIHRHCSIDSSNYLGKECII